MASPPAAKKPRLLETSAADGSAAPDLSAVVHGERLPGSFADNVPAWDARILRFLLRFLAAESLNTPVYVNGGYVRDLLLGKQPDDLDVSICLRGCPEGVTVGGLLARLPAFAAGHGELGLREVKIATILSNESKDKNVDTFKGHFTDFEGRKVEVDVMPTIGAEVYGEVNRTPVRDQRGTPEQDALRRDLTIGAMLLQVEDAGATAEAAGLAYTLYDFYGGLADLQRGVLRAPCPREGVAAVRAAVLRSEADLRLAEALALDDLPETECLQVLWWAKILMDDPLRICRALRFSTKLGFPLHEAFWQAAPFAMEALRCKVAGGRKNIEYVKIAGYGPEAAARFFALAFAHTFGPAGSLRLAPAAFGGQDDKGRVKTMPDVRSFDEGLFSALAREPEGLSDPAMLAGALLAASIFAADLGGGPGTAAQAFQSACSGMCVSNMTREAGDAAFQAAAKLAAPPSSPGRLELSFAAALGAPAEDLCLHAQVWEATQLQGAAAQWSAPNREAVWRLGLGMLRHTEPQRAEALADSVELICRRRPPIRGSFLAETSPLKIPRLLIRPVKTLLEVALRSLRHSSPLESMEHVEELLQAHPALRQTLDGSVWLEEDGCTVRPEFAHPGRRKAAKKK